MLESFKSIPVGSYLSSELISTFVLGAILYAICYALSRGQQESTSANYRFWRLTLRNIAIALFVLSLTIIWRKELQSIIVGLGAAAAGCIIGFKEQWQSLIAFWVRVVKNTYNLHDFIEVEGVRGKVIDITWLTTAVAETRHEKDPMSFTGKVVHIPNHKMLNSNLLVFNLTGAFSVHTVEVTLPKGANILKAKDYIQDAANLVCARYVDAATLHMHDLRKKQGLDTPDVTPRVRLHIGNEGVGTLMVRIVVPFTKRARIEQEIIHKFLETADTEAWPRIVKLT